MPPLSATLTTFVVRGFIPDGLRSGPNPLNAVCLKKLDDRTGAAAQPIGDKSPRHNSSSHQHKFHCSKELRLAEGWVK
jgi:hypothetical protein